MLARMRHSALRRRSPASAPKRYCARAIAIAAKIPGARKGTVEIRQIVELSGLP
jgi:hypothetical protein